MVFVEGYGRIATLAFKQVSRGTATEVTETAAHHRHRRLSSTSSSLELLVLLLFLFLGLAFTSSKNPASQMLSKSQSLKSPQFQTPFLTRNLPPVQNNPLPPLHLQRPIQAQKQNSKHVNVLLLLRSPRRRPTAQIPFPRI